MSELHEPLVINDATEQHEVTVPEIIDEHPPATLSNSKQAVLNLVNSAIGAGMMALPLAFARLGLIGGSIALVACGCLTSFSLVGLVKASVRSQRLGSYADLVQHRFGDRGSALLQAAILANNSGNLIVYLIIITDVLIGTAPEYSGLLSLAFPWACGRVWYFSRWMATITTCVLLVAPMLSLRDMTALSRMSVFAVGSAGFFASLTVLLALLAAATGHVASESLFPTMADLGGSPVHVALTVLSTLPIIVTAYLCHFNLHPIAAELRKFSERKMKRVVRISMAVTGSIYMGVGVGAVLVFGKGVKEDVLESFTVPVLAPLLGGSEQAAITVSVLVRVAYMLSLIFTFPLVNFTLRQTVVNVLARKFNIGEKGLGGAPRRVSPAFFHGVGYSLLTVFCLISTVLPGIWIALQITGSTASVFISFIMPALLVLQLERDEGKNRLYVRLLCGTLMGLGIMSGTVGVGTVLRHILAPPAAAAPPGPGTNPASAMAGLLGVGGNGNANAGGAYTGTEAGGALQLIMSILEPGAGFWVLRRLAEVVRQPGSFGGERALWVFK